MIRLALALTLVAGAASPALAFSTQSIQAPHNSAHHEFGNASVLRMAPSGVSSNALRDPAKPTDAKTVVYTLPAGKPASQVDINDPKNNPFLAPNPR